MALRELFNRCKMVQPPDTITGVTINSSPGIAYTVYAYLSAQPVEKWVSFLTGVFVALQIFFFIKDRIAKKRERKPKK